MTASACASTGRDALASAIVQGSPLRIPSARELWGVMHRRLTTHERVLIVARFRLVGEKGRVLSVCEAAALARISESYAYEIQRRALRKLRAAAARHELDVL